MTGRPRARAKARGYRSLSCWGREWGGEVQVSCLMWLAEEGKRTYSTSHPGVGGWGCLWGGPGPAPPAPPPFGPPPPDVKHVLGRIYVVFPLFCVCVAWGRFSARWTCRRQ